jgi:hypothetical protein
MSRTLLSALTITALWGTAGVAHANPISFTNALVHSMFINRDAETMSFTHDLGLEGFDPDTDTLDTSTLMLYFRDDNDSAAETVDITIDDELFNNMQVISGSSSTRLLFDVEALLTPAGLLSVLVSRQNGDFWLDQSILTASGARTLPDLSEIPDDPALVPEPGTLVLLGSGLLGAAVTRRFRLSSITVRDPAPRQDATLGRV